MTHTQAMPRSRGEWLAFFAWCGVLLFGLGGMLAYALGVSDGTAAFLILPGGILALGCMVAGLAQP